MTGWVERRLLPGLAFKAVVIGGGYATGRELATFFLPSGPRGGLYAMGLAMLIWCAVCIVTFLFALRTHSADYRTFFQNLLGPLWPIFEVAYLLALVVILAAFTAAAGTLGEALFSWPPLLGALLFMASVSTVVTFGNRAVEALFKYVSLLLYATYAIFVVLQLSRFGDRAIGALVADTPTDGWAIGGLTYAGYNIIGAVIILPALRHLQTRRDAVIAGLLAGPLAMLPAVAFFVCMIPHSPAIDAVTLPSEYLLGQLGSPVFRLIFQLMIFSALLESATGGVHAINERAAAWYQGRRDQSFPRLFRFSLTIAILTISVFVAGRFGLVAVIADGYRWLAYIFLTIYVLPLMTIGLWRVLRWYKASDAYTVLPMQPADRPI